MRAVFTARLVWLLIEISDNSREMENYDQPESHALCHRNLLEWRGLELFIPSRLVVFCQYCDSSASPNRRPGITGPSARTGRPLPLTQREKRNAHGGPIRTACALSFPGKSDRLFFRADPRESDHKSSSRDYGMSAA